MARVLSVLLIRNKDSKAETISPQQLIAKLLRWAYRFSPVVALDSHVAPLGFRSKQGEVFCGINFDVSGCERLFKSETRLLAQIKADLKPWGMTCRAALAPTLGAAWAMSRCGKEQIIAEGEIRRALAGLPIQALRLGEKTVAALQELNITQIEHLFALPRSALYGRFDRELTLRLNQALGIEQEPLTAIAYTPSLKAQRTFPSPITEMESLLLHLEQALDEILQKLQQQRVQSSAAGTAERKISRLMLELSEPERPKHCREIQLSLPSRNRVHLKRLLETHVERMVRERGWQNGVESFILHAPATEPLNVQKTSYLPEQADAPESRTKMLSDTAFAQLLDTLRGKLGKDAVLQCTPCESHIPERTVAYTPLNVELNSKRSESKKLSALTETDRPSLLFYKPYPIHAMAVLPDTPPFWLKLNGTTHRIITGIGPERIAPEWWGKDSELCLSRDYFKVQLSCGTWLWIYREIAQSAWFVHGVWA